MIFATSRLVLDLGIADYSRFYENGYELETARILVVRQWQSVREVEFDPKPYQRGYNAIVVKWDHPELRALAYSCAQAEPVVDWLLEHAESDDQRKLAAELEKLIGAAHS